jgi:hypothetical protein
MSAFPLALRLALASTPTADPRKVVTLPDGISLLLRLETLIDSKESHAGDLVFATVLKDAKRDGKVVVPKRAVVRGRIEFLNYGLGRFTVGLSFSEAEVDGTKVELRAQLESIFSDTGLIPSEWRPAVMGRRRAPELFQYNSPTLYHQDVDQSGAVHATVLRGDDATSGVKSTPGVGMFYILLAHEDSYRSSRVPAFQDNVKLQGLQMNWRTTATP